MAPLRGLDTFTLLDHRAMLMVSPLGGSLLSLFSIIGLRSMLMISPLRGLDTFTLLDHRALPYDHVYRPFGAWVSFHDRWNTQRGLSAEEHDNEHHQKQ